VDQRFSDHFGPQLNNFDKHDKQNVKSEKSDKNSSKSYRPNQEHDLKTNKNSEFSSNLSREPGPSIKDLNSISSADDEQINVPNSHINNNLISKMNQILEEDNDSDIDQNLTSKNNRKINVNTHNTQNSESSPEHNFDSNALNQNRRNNSPITAIIDKIRNQKSTDRNANSSPNQQQNVTQTNQTNQTKDIIINNNKNFNQSQPQSILLNKDKIKQDQEEGKKMVGKASNLIAQIRREVDSKSSKSLDSTRKMDSLNHKTNSTNSASNTQNASKLENSKHFAEDDELPSPHLAEKEKTDKSVVRVEPNSSVQNNNNYPNNPLENTTGTVGTANSLDDLLQVDSGDDMEDFLNEHQKKMQEFQKSMEDISRSKNRLIAEINTSVDESSKWIIMIKDYSKFKMKF